jgi:hypothetical protein
MPLPSFVISATIIVCERVLFEKDDTLSAIRIVDVFHVASPLPGPYVEPPTEETIPTDAPVVHAWAIASIKATPGYTGTHNVDIKLLSTAGVLVPVGDTLTKPFGSTVPESPTAIGVVAQLKLLVRRVGTCYVCLYLDDNELARSPITFRPVTHQ